MSKQKVAASHVEWLSLVETTGTFLTVPVVRRVFPSGIDPVSPDLRSEVRLRLASPPKTQAEATGWTRWVIRDLLGLSEALLEGPAVPDRATHFVAEQGVLLRPEFAVADLGGQESEKPLRLLVLVFPFGAARDKALAGDRWAATPIERAFTLQRATGIPLVMATDGDWFSLVATPPGGSATTATWISSLFAEEPVLLDSFTALLGARRFFAVDAPNLLPALLSESAQAQEEVTSRLGTQVRQAVELLVGALSRANRARHGELLADVTAEDVYAAALTVMMRLVFLLYSEERDLLPAREELYAQSYGVLGLREQLQEESDRFGAETLERRSAAWHRLLATFRAIHGGIEHEALRLPAYGGGLFDPDRYPFLEGRRDGEPWRSRESHPLPVDDRSILAILKALQILSFRDAGITEARRLSYRSLDVEQIGHVYEGLLDHGATRVDDLAVGLRGLSTDGPELALALIEKAAAKGHEHLINYLLDETGRSRAQIEKGLSATATPEQEGGLRSACEHDEFFWERVLPYVGLLDEDLRGLPMVFLPGSVYVTKTTERRDTGTQYTPKDLADEIVRYALEPLVYAPGPAEGAKPEEWIVRRPEEILALRICDPAVGSGAILVASCRFLSERLLESVNRHIPIDSIDRPLDPTDPDAGLMARRLIVDHCLYGVDRNPLAGEMAKLSLWLVTLAKERPFTFLDHAIRIGDSLVGVTSLDQVRYLHLDPARGRRLHGNLLAVSDAIQPLVDQALKLTKAMKAVEPVTVHDVDEQRHMSAEAERALDRVRIVADAVLGKALVAELPGSLTLDQHLEILASEIKKAVDPRRSEVESLALWVEIRDQALYDLDAERPPMAPPRRPLHWPLAFPELWMSGENNGFDAIVGNPPFSGGKRISGPNGTSYRSFLVDHIAGGRRGNADLVAYFFLRTQALCRATAYVGFFATNTISEGDTREVGLDQLLKGGTTVYRAVKSRPWPGHAALEIAEVWMSIGVWVGRSVLDGEITNRITAQLEAEGRVRGQPYRLAENLGVALRGSLLNGIGFAVTRGEADRLVASDPRNRRVVKPYLGGDDLMTDPTQLPSRCVVDFSGMDLLEASGFAEPFALVRERVKPSRDRLPSSKARVRDQWWRYEYEAETLYQASGSLRRVAVFPETAVHPVVQWVPTGGVFAYTLVVIVCDDEPTFGVLSSSIHQTWILRYASTLESRIRYTTSDVFETFPRPEPSPSIGKLARALDDYRRGLMIHRQEGLTRTYNRVNDHTESSPDIAELRRLHVDLDEAVAAAYQWGTIPLDHGFHETRTGIRYTVGPGARAEILDRLLELNHSRHVREESAKTTGAQRSRRQAQRSPGQLSIVGDV